MSYLISSEKLRCPQVSNSISNVWVSVSEGSSSSLLKSSDNFPTVFSEAHAFRWFLQVLYIKSITHFDFFVLQCLHKNYFKVFVKMIDAISFSCLIRKKLPVTYFLHPVKRERERRCGILRRWLSHRDYLSHYYSSVSRSPTRLSLMRTEIIAVLSQSLAVPGMWYDLNKCLLNRLRESLEWSSLYNTIPHHIHFIPFPTVC